jgi:hypothetical protein
VLAVIIGGPVLRSATVAVVGLVLALAGCGGGDDSQAANGLEARLLDEADDVYAGPAGVFALDSSDLTRVGEDGELEGSPIGVAADQPRIAIGTDAAWVTDVSDHSAFRLDLATGDQLDLDMGAVDPVWVAAPDDGGAWVNSGTELVPFDDDGEPGAPVPLPCSTEELVAGLDALWTFCDQGVVRVDPATGAADPIDVGGEPAAIAATDAALWVLTGERLVPIDASGQIGAEVAAPANATSIAGTGAVLWVTADRQADDAPEQVTHHDAASGRRTAGPISLPGGTDDVAAASASIAAAGRSLWFTLAFYGGPLGVVEPAGG